MGRALLLAGLNISEPYRVGRYGVHLSNLAQMGVEALRRAFRQPGVPVVVIDECGKMELFLGWLQQDQGEGPRDGENAPLDA